MSKADIASIGQFYAELTKIVKEDLLVEYSAGRITGDAYSTTYSQLMAVIVQSVPGYMQSMQKLINDKAAVQDRIEELVDVTDEVGTVQGSIGKQKEVYQTQITAFRDRALQDFTNNILNTWSVRRTTDPDTAASSENLLTDLDIGKTIKHVADHLGVPLPDPK